MTDTPITDDLSPDDISPSLGGQHTDLTDAPSLGGASRMAHLLEALEDSDPAVRARATDALGELGGDAAINRLIALLIDPQPDIRAQAARALGRARSTEAADMLIDALRDDSERVRWNAAEALGRIGHEGAVRQLLAATQARDQVMRERAAEALGRIGAVLPAGALRDAIPPALLEMLRVSSAIMYPRLSGVVSFALLEIGDAAISALVAALEQADGRLSETAAEVLGYIVVRTADPLLRGQVVGALLRAAPHREPFIARAAIRALNGAASSLVQGGDSTLARQVIVGLRALYAAVSQSPTSVDAITLGGGILRRGVIHVSPRTTTYICPDLILTLGAVAREHPDLPAEVLPMLIDALYEDETEMRRAALDALSRIIDLQPTAASGAIPALADRLHDDAGRPFSRELRIGDAAELLLRRLGTPEALDALAKSGR